ncbi:hypothetical protein GCM10010106_17320 [Thermopolyspora flexuosa]|jgi:hypothetical protein|uniref:Uncharacterized protein n=1 Tax=Thermopolyspora flexuosa TaxID=103836 RepID=A0A543J4C6_9ACTN|nr:hypothetical protein [Thermopolyspora flexuosa]TQM77679.1 hypothetical protein FHX40_4450 [Thermopolyspora flexuosa]GGM71539.1 hypothetical protein GCM10010106_17320 [Thermopolyspora flexuosa]
MTGKEFNRDDDAPEGRFPQDDDGALDGRLVPPGANTGAPNGVAPVHLCHHGCDCWQRNFDAYLHRTPARRPEQLDNLEAHALLYAKNQGSQLVQRHADRLNAQRERLIGAYHAAEASLTELRALVHAEELGAAVRELRRVTEARIESGAKPPPLWLRALAWPTVIAVGLFDTWYFKGVFQQFVGNTDISALEEVLTLLPGFALTVGLLISGTILGGPVYRARRTHHERQLRRTGLARGLAGLAYWVFRLTLPAMLVICALVWAVQRTREANASLGQAGDVPYLELPTDFVAILILTLTLCALALKIVAYDPFVSEEYRARRRLRRANRATTRLLRKAGKLVKRHDVAWSDLKALREEMIARIVERYAAAYQFVLYSRGFHDKAGGVPPAFATAGRTDSLRDRLRPELHGVTGPEPEFGALQEVDDALRRFEPEPLAEELRRLREAWVAQRGDGAPVTAATVPARLADQVP